jgi:uncharacterized protein YjiS (DUF1127 family)
MDSSGAFDPNRLMTYGSPERTPVRKSTDLDSPAALEEVAPRGVSTCSDTPIVILRRGYAGNDATCEDPAISNDDAEPWAQHALAANGFGDVATTDTDSSARPTIYELHQAARVHRSFTLGTIIIGVIQAAGGIARRAHARHRQRRQARDLDGALHQLDDRTLREFARAHRSFSLGEIIVAVIQAAGAIARRAHARHRQRRQAWDLYDALQQLDNHTLRDLGFDRSEIRSVAAEVTGEAEYTRVRALLTSHSLPSAGRA